MITIICKHIYYCNLVNYSMSYPCLANKVEWALFFAFRGQSWGKTRSWTYTAHRFPVTNHQTNLVRHRLDNLTSWKVTKRFISHSIPHKYYNTFLEVKGSRYLQLNFCVLWVLWVPFLGIRSTVQLCCICVLVKQKGNTRRIVSQVQPAIAIFLNLDILNFCTVHSRFYVLFIYFRYLNPTNSTKNLASPLIPLPLVLEVQHDFQQW
jgi:hypothetical protein